jgi:hypothetical protein
LETQDSQNHPEAMTPGIATTHNASSPLAAFRPRFMAALPFPTLQSASTPSALPHPPPVTATTSLASPSTATACSAAFQLIRLDVRCCGGWRRRHWYGRFRISVHRRGHIRRAAQRVLALILTRCCRCRVRVVILLVRRRRGLVVVEYAGTRVSS